MLWTLLSERPVGQNRQVGFTAIYHHRRHYQNRFNVGALTRQVRCYSPTVFLRPKDLEEIIQKAALKLKVPIDKASILEIAKRARGTPRIALKLLKRARDFVQVKGEGKLTEELIIKSFGHVGG